MADKDLSRRGFLGKATAGIATAMAAVWAIPGIAAVLDPARKRPASQQWKALGSVDKVEPGTPSLFKTKVTKTAGWVTTESEVAIYVYTEDGRDYIGLSNICTHLGCRVRWIESEGHYLSPCHTGIFAKDGTVISGPPPRPLDRYELKIEDGQLYAKIEV